MTDKQVEKLPLAEGKNPYDIYDDRELQGCGAFNEGLKTQHDLDQIAYDALKARCEKMKSIQLTKAEADCLVWDDCATCPQGKTDSS